MGRSPCCQKVGLKKGPWTPEEDQKLLAYIEEYGHGSWRALPSKAGLQRCGKSCRLRWTNYLRPDIKRGKFSIQEEQTIIQLHALLGNRWSAIATHLPKRTDNEIKNYWNTHLKKRLAKMGIDPVTHKPKSDTVSSADGQSTKSVANLSHMAQWESARLEAEARLVRESKLTAPSTSTATSLQSPLQQQQLLQLDTAVLLPQLHDKSVSNTAMSSLDVIRTRQGVWPKSTSGSQAQIDLQSPTSTLSFSAESMVQPSMGVAGQNSTIMCRQGDEGLEGEELEFKCFGVPIRLSDTTDHRIDDLPAAGFSMNMNTTVFSAEESWLIPESSSIRIESSSRNLGPAGLFTEMLLDNSDEQNSCANDSDNAEGGSCLVEEDQDEVENNSYWNNMLDLVNSSPPSNSPPPVF